MKRLLYGFLVWEEGLGIGVKGLGSKMEDQMDKTMENEIGIGA